MNQAMLVGRLTITPELKWTQNGMAVCEFLLACQRSYREKDGSYLTDFIPITAWKTNAEFITKHFEKGSLIGITGSIQSRAFTDKEGKKRTYYCVVVDGVSFIQKRKNPDKEDEVIIPPIETTEENEEEGKCQQLYL